MKQLVGWPLTRILSLCLTLSLTSPPSSLSAFSTNSLPYFFISCFFTCAQSARPDNAHRGCCSAERHRPSMSHPRLSLPLAAQGCQSDSPPR